MLQAEIHNEDCIAGMARRLKPGSAHLTVTSIPFEELFTYSGKVEDVGNNGSTVDVKSGRFALNLRMFCEQLLQAHAPGTNACIHIQQLLAYKVQHGFMGRRDFRGAVIDVFRSAGWNFVGEAACPGLTPPLVTADDVQEVLEQFGDDPHALTSALGRMLGIPQPSEVAIYKDPQQMAQRLNLHSLQFKTGYARSSTQWAPAVNDYVVIFQKPGEVQTPVKALRHRLNPDGWLTQEDWILWARGTWDIDPLDILDGARSKTLLAGLKEAEHEKHVCPLQKSVIERCVLLYSNPATIQPDMLVLDPFMGIGSTAYVSLLNGRNVVGFELKESYHRQALVAVAAAREIVRKRDEENAEATLFDSLV